MTTPLLPRAALLLGLLGGGLSAGAGLANPWRPNPNPNPGLHLGWVQAQRAWADQSYRQTQRRLEQLEQCLGRASHRWDADRCLRRDEQARQRQWQRDQQDWQSLQQRQGAIAQQPWRPLY